MASPVSELEHFYNLKAVVQRTGIPAASLRAWERRYGLLTPVRKPNGHRVYPAAEVEKLLRVKALMEQGMTISQAAGEVEKLTAAEPKPVQSEADRLRRELAEALAKGQTALANALLAQALDLMPAEKVCLRLLRPLFPELNGFGRSWVRFRLGALLLHAPPLGHAPVALVISPDPQDLLPLLAAVFLSRRSHSVIYVEGTETPPEIRADLLIDPRQWADGKPPEHYFRQAGG